MTTEKDDLQDRIAAQGQGRVNSDGRTQDAWGDVSGTYPQYGPNESGVNRAARGEKINNLDVKTTVPNVEHNIMQDTATVYPKSDINESETGHVIEINDTPGGERILIHHNTGAGFDIRPDGTIVINSKNNNVESTDGNKYMAIGGDGKITVFGNLDLDVRGDMNLKVGGNLNWRVGGTVVGNVVGSLVTRISGSVRRVITGDLQDQVLGNTFSLGLGGFTQYVKGNFKSAVHGSTSLFSKISTRISSENELDIASNNINIGARDLTAIADKGTIGGQNVIMYNYNMHTEKSVWAETMSAETFHGDLSGKAKLAASSEHQSYSDPDGGGGVGSRGSITETALDEKATVLPTGALMNDFLDNTEAGITKINIDPDGTIAQGIDHTQHTGNVTDRLLTKEEVRARLRNPSHLANTAFYTSQIAAGNLASNFANSSPSSIGRVIATTDNTYTGENIIGRFPDDGFRGTTFRQTESSGQSRNLTILVEGRFNPNRWTSIAANTPLSNKITLARFLGGAGDPANINHITDLEERRQILRNLLPHTGFINLFNTLKSTAGHNLVITEGLYRPSQTETIDTDSILDLRQTGRAVAYEVHNNTTGSLSPEKLFDFARLVKNASQFEELSLRYDTFDPNGAQHVSLVITTPNIPSNLTAKFEQKLSTYYNEALQSATSLVEMTPAGRPF